VYVCADGPTAFREERRRCARREDARAVVMLVGEEGWREVPLDSVVRPDPAPPRRPRRLPWWDRLGRGGEWLGWLGRRRCRNRSPFGP
jgi:hypothetical protein